jgi:hypothetical protein
MLRRVSEMFEQSSILHFDLIHFGFFPRLEMDVFCDPSLLPQLRQYVTVLTKPGLA